jgi:L-lactate dehydrogenase (cytochrome)
MSALPYFNPNYPTTQSLRHAARRRIPKFAFDYLQGGCFNDIALAKNRQQLESAVFASHLTATQAPPTYTTSLFGHDYNAPFGIAPMGMQGLIWPNSPQVLAKAAFQHNIPFVLSNVSSASIEEIGEISEGRAWFQLYNPTAAHIRRHMLKRAQQAAFHVLVVTIDVPTYGYRPRDIKNGLAMPPKMSFTNIMQMLKQPRWLTATLRHGIPHMATLMEYADKHIPPDELASFLDNTVMGPVDRQGLQEIRDLWPGPLVIKGITSEVDLQVAIAIGADGIMISNHGGRQLDRGLTPIEVLARYASKYQDKITLLCDSGVESGDDIAVCLGMGAKSAFLGRTFMYGMAALGHQGAEHVITMLNTQLAQITSQLKCQNMQDFSNKLIR